MSEMCLQAVLTSSAYVHALSTCTYVTDVLTKNYSPLVLNVALRIARRGVERFTLIGKRTRREHDINWARRMQRPADLIASGRLSDVSAVLAEAERLAGGAW